MHSPTERELSPGRESGVRISICDPERIRRVDAVDEVKRVLEVAERIPFRFLVQHLGHSHETRSARAIDGAFNSLEHLSIFAKERGVTIAAREHAKRIWNTGSAVPIDTGDTSARLEILF